MSLNELQDKMKKLQQAQPLQPLQQKASVQQKTAMQQPIRAMQQHVQKKTYIEQILLRDEKILHQSNLSLWSQFILIFLAVFLSPYVIITTIRGYPSYLFIAIFLGLIAIVAIKYFTTEIGVTDKRVIYKTGFISRKTIELKLEKIESISVAQGIIGRFKDFGTIIITGSGGSKSKMRGIKEPIELSKAVNQLI